MLLTSAQFRARKEEDRSKDLRNKPRKKLKLDHEDNVDCLTKINIGVMIMKDGRLSIKDLLKHHSRYIGFAAIACTVSTR